MKQNKIIFYIQNKIIPFKKNKRKWSSAQATNRVKMGHFNTFKIKTILKDKLVVSKEDDLNIKRFFKNELTTFAHKYVKV